MNIYSVQEHNPIALSCRFWMVRVRGDLEGAWNWKTIMKIYCMKNLFSINNKIGKNRIIVTGPIFREGFHPSHSL